jgi:hypothetical protein
MKWQLLVDEGYITADGREVLVDSECREAPAWASVEDARRGLIASGTFRPEDLHPNEAQVDQRVDVSQDPSFASLGATGIWRRVRASPVDGHATSLAPGDERRT